ncbi:DNA mismatch repair protein msh-2 [Verticillium dahliae VDG1]|nr:DNA mismatch repair protein msh-2 [Verticillium dahliae VDG1]
MSKLTPSPSHGLDPALAAAAGFNNPLFYRKRPHAPGSRPAPAFTRRASARLPPMSGRPGSAELEDLDEDLPQEELTQAGTKRRRIRRACVPCRSHKAKCSGAQPCSRCASNNLQCIYGDADQGRSLPIGHGTTLSSGSASAVTRHPAGLVTSPSAVTDGRSVPTPGSRGSFTSEAVRYEALLDRPRVFDLDRKDVIRQCLDAYFEKTDLVDCPFLHKASLMADWNQGKLDNELLKAVCAAGLRLIGPAQEDDDSVPHAWMREVRKGMLTNLGTTTVAELQTMVLYIKFGFTSQFTEDVWTLLSVAARMAFTKRLNYERPSVEPVRRECLRRLMWGIYFLDKIFSSGIEDLAVCPTHRLHIRLPSNDYYFQRGLASRSQYLHEKGDSSGADMDAIAYRMRLMDLRDRILRYTKRVIRSGTSPSNTKDELLSLDRELQTFRESLPEELQLTPSRLMFMCHSRDSTAYIILHSTLILCRCDLHRFLVPGMKETVSPEAMAATSQEYIAYCQQTCIDSAVKLCDMWSQVYHLDAHRLIDSPTLTITLYQCVKVVEHAYWLLPQHGEHSLVSIKGKLMEALCMARRIQETYAWLRPCIADIQRIVPTLGLRGRPSVSPPGGPNDRQVHFHSNANWHPLNTPNMPPPPQQYGTPFAGGYTPQDDGGMHYGSVHVVPTHQANAAGLAVPFEDPDIMMPLDPFDLQLNAYTDYDFPSVFGGLD